MAEKMAMAVLLRWQEANKNINIWQDKENGVLFPFAEEMLKDFKRQIEIEMQELD